ncbi:MAG: WSC domain-containing protein [SAR324 cluster bacterium]|nr:WSC domain-containing protein [SAR324 cluster bacterium]
MRHYISLFCLIFILVIAWIDTSDANETQVYSNRNKSTVQNLNIRLPTFTINQPMIITRINTYHWNNGRGTSQPGQIGIKGAGSWQAKGSPGMRNTPNAEWQAFPNIQLNPGTYTIVDSDPATWSQNSGSQGLGFVAIYGKPVGGGGWGNQAAFNIQGIWADGPEASAKKINVKQNGNQITGTYHEGRSVLQGTLQGNTVTGRFGYSRKMPTTGQFTWTFKPDGREFIGKWCNGLGCSPSNLWDRGTFRRISGGTAQPSQSASRGNYLGCFKDSNNPFDMGPYWKRPGGNKNSVDWCINHCRGKNYKYAGLQYAVSCACGNTYGNQGRAPEKDCSMPCPGNKNQKCGAAYRNSVYSTGL